MKILAIVSSVNKDGKTAASARSIIEGAETGGTEGNLVFLTEMNLQRCRQCDSEGWGNCRYVGRCIIEDDFQKLVEEIRESEIIVFATPVYFSDISESIRGVLERLRRTCITEKGRPEIAGKPVVGICHAGGSGGGSIACMHNLEMMLIQCGFSIEDMVSVRRQNFEVKQEMFRILGKWLVESADA
ncbi:MAG: flavodoxin family protein [Armatimonadota bacterium]